MLGRAQRQGSAARAVVIAVLAISGALSACGGVAENAIVVRVGNQAITRATVDHWERVIKRGGSFVGFRGNPQGTPERRALALLITSNWLLAEAARQGIPIEQAEVDQALATRESEGGGFQKRMRATGRTLADLEFEIRSELADEAIREKLAEQADNVTQQELLGYYRQNRSLFSTPELRVTDLLENQPSPAAAAALVHRLGTGSRFTKLAYHEQVERSPGFMGTPQKKRFVEAIFAARPGVASSPMPLNSGWAVFVVREVVPPHIQPFGKVRAEVLTDFRIVRQRSLKLAFDREYTQFWRSRTKCEHGFIGPGCPQYSAPLGMYEDPFSLRAHLVLKELGSK